MDDITARQERILRIIVREYVTTAIPVSSESVAQRLEVAVSPATVRNDMAVLAEKGYVMHPHTSAGRVPTDKGYRYFVERLMGQVELPEAERLMIQHQFHQVEGDQDQWLRLAAAMLARALPSASVVVPPMSPACHLKHIQVVPIHDNVVLLVVVLQEGAVKQSVLTLTEPVTDDLTAISNKLNASFAGQTREQIEARTDDLTPFQRLILESALRIMRALDGQIGEEVYHHGLAYILAQPEFGDIQRARAMVEMMERGQLLARILPGVRRLQDITVIIGSETSVDEMRGCSIVLASYGIPGQISGILGIVGPTRMPYWRALPSVGHMSALISGLLQEAYG